MAALPFELALALRYLRPKRTFVSVITIISVIGVMLGVAVLIIVLSVMTGFDLQLREKILGFNAHVRLFDTEGLLRDYAAVAAKISQHPRVRGVAPIVLGKVMIETQPKEGNPVQDAPWIRGIDPLVEHKVSNLPTNIIAGEYDVGGRSVLIGRELARNLRLEVGDRLSLYSTVDLSEMRRRQGQSNEVAILPDEYTVRGIFDVGYFEYNANFLIISLENAQELFRLEDTVHGVLVMLDDPMQAGEVRRELRPAFGPEFEMTLWTEENANILNALVVEKNMMFYLLIFIVLVAAFGIMNSQITFVVQKTREIGILKALGATQAQIVLLFLAQSLVVGVAGVVLGYALGMLALEFRNEFLHFMNRTMGFELFPASIYNFAELPARIVPGDIALICGSALFFCLLAGMVPALSATRLKPVEALRHE